MPQRAPYLTSRLQGFGETIFAEMSALALRTGAINLGQGFPDVDGPAEVSDAAIAAIRAGHNQYPPGIGVRELRHAVSVHQRAFWDLDYDPDLEVLVTAGATEAIAASLQNLQGAIVVRGHTDGRPYRSTTYDNWRLSSARAQMAYYMLIRGGLPEKRFERVEGYADHRLRERSHPLAAENRRIEILVREAKP